MTRNEQRALERALFARTRTRARNLRALLRAQVVPLARWTLPSASGGMLLGTSNERRMIVRADARTITRGHSRARCARASARAHRPPRSHEQAAVAARRR